MVRRSLKRLVLVLFLGLGLPAAWTVASAAERVSGGQAQTLVKAGAGLVDVRTVEEFASGHVTGARNIPVDELARRLQEVGPKDAPVVVYCQSGRRSARAADLLRDAGFTKVYDLGPISAWNTK